MAPDVKALILGILKRERKPLTVREIQDTLKEMGFNFTYYWLKLKLDELSSLGSIVKLRDGRLTRYADLSVRPFATLDQFIGFSTSDHVERARVGEEARLSEEGLKIFEYAVQEWLGAIPTKVWSEVLKPKLVVNKNLLRFANENPRSLLIESIERLLDLYNKIILRHKHSTNLEERSDLVKKRMLLEDAMRDITSYVGIPIEPSGITINFGKERGEIVDKDLIIALLKANVFGDNIIMQFEPSKGFSAKNPIVTVGIDGTQFEISAGYVLGRATFALGSIAYTAPIYINAAVASWLEALEDKDAIHDPRPTPEEWAEYTHHKAISEGLILTPGELARYSESIWKRAAEAAMNAVEYRKARETIRPPKGVLGRLPNPEPSIVTLDGRLFPYEHVVDDYMHDHHEQVKAAIQEFNALVAFNDAYNDHRNPTTLYCGLVKRSPYQSFKILLACWMLKENLLSEEEFWKILSHSCNMPDGWLLWKIFSLMREMLDGNNMLISFQVKRPFASMVRGEPLKDLLEGVRGRDVNDRVEALKDQSRWSEVLEKYAERKNKPMIDVKPYAVICAKGHILTFFCDVPYLSKFEHIVLPRFEVLVPYSAVGSTIDDFIKVAVGRIASLLCFRKNWMVFHKLYLQEGEPQETSMIVTREVNSAHEYANLLGRHYKAVVIGLLEKALIELLSRS